MATGNTTKRDFLIGLEKQFQQEWQERKLFETRSPYETKELPVPTSFSKEQHDEIQERYRKYFVNFAFPYMNGSLHLGHGFSFSKVEFTAGFHRMLGERVLFPVGFHCTGLPIKASADKLIREMEMFGADFENYDKVQAEKAAADDASAPDAAPGALKKKGKIAAKSTGLTYQFQIMESIGIARTDIKKFADANYWIEYFPPLAIDDMNALGFRVDWRHQFCTTPVNPYYDSFVRWQVNKLKRLGYIKFGKRYTIFSIKDGQPCMDHDRSSGEGVGPQEYTGIKMPVTAFGERAAELAAAVGDRSAVLVAATLRPETMYGQTNCFVGPSVEYGVYEAAAPEDGSAPALYIVTPRAARNMAFQGLLKTPDVAPTSLYTFKGAALVGSQVSAPLSVHQSVYVLPMDSVAASKGTAVVTCVPSDSPDDYITSHELAKKPAMYGIDPAWVGPPAVPILSTPTYGDLTAKTLVEKLKINSPKDVKQLAEAKELAYKEGFYQGTMLVGQYKGKRVEEAKPLVREELISAGLALSYSEPESPVTSRSGDDCIVALCDQWYLDYGEESWKAKTIELLKRCDCYSEETRHGFERTLDWLKQWACARSYGLGTKLPWDPEFLVESLTDSTVYMAYYTVSHLLHGSGGVSYQGRAPGPLGITPEEMTDDVWEYILATAPYPTDAALPKEKADRLKAEFSYYYPFDLRSSGKDLIPNHLTFCLYTHAALFAEEYWPRSIRANGHLMLNGEKMSKSKGNFLTLRDAVSKFGADATRLALADAGDFIEDANFEEATANASILRLKTLIEWCEEVCAAEQRAVGDANLWDDIFEQQIRLAIQLSFDAYEKAMYKDALKHGLYNLLSARDFYREACTLLGVGMRADLVRRFVGVQALLLTPITPHTAEYLHKTILGNKTSVQESLYPERLPIDQGLIDQGTYIQSVLKDIRDAELSFSKRKAKGKSAGLGYDPAGAKAVKVFVAKTFPAWQESAVAIVKDAYDGTSFNDAQIKATLAEKGLIKDKRFMPFIAVFKRRIVQLGAETAFNRTVLFDELSTLQTALPYLRRQLGIENLNFVAVEDADANEKGYLQSIVETAEPASPGIVFYNP